MTNFVSLFNNLIANSEQQSKDLSSSWKELPTRECESGIIEEGKKVIGNDARERLLDDIRKAPKLRSRTERNVDSMRRASEPVKSTSVLDELQAKQRRSMSLRHGTTWGSKISDEIGSKNGGREVDSITEIAKNLLAVEMEKFKTAFLAECREVIRQELAEYSTKS